MEMPAPWRPRLTEFYLNVGRLAQILERAGHRILVPQEVSEHCLDSLELMTSIRLRRDIAAGLEKMTPLALPLSPQTVLREESEGQLVSFDRGFRTKNGPTPHDHASHMRPAQKPPYIYAKYGQVKVVIEYEARWVTSTSGFVAFRAGQQRFVGLGYVLSGSIDSTVRVNPLIMGIPTFESYFA